MKEIDEKATRLLLSKLDNEIDNKCMELQEKKQEAQLKRIFFSSCIAVLFLFLMQVFFSIFNMNLLIIFFVFQGIALLVVLPILLNLNKDRRVI